MASGVALHFSSSCLAGLRGALPAKSWVSTHGVVPGAPSLVEKTSPTIPLPPTRLHFSWFWVPYGHSPPKFFCQMVLSAILAVPGGCVLQPLLSLWLHVVGTWLLSLLSGRAPLMHNGHLRSELSNPPTLGIPFSDHRLERPITIKNLDKNHEQHQHINGRCCLGLPLNTIRLGIPPNEHISNKSGFRRAPFKNVAWIFWGAIVLV